MLIGIFEKASVTITLTDFLELEGIIKDAAGTLSIISPNWKQSQISMQEFHFSRDVGTPVFLLKVGEPGPTLALSGLTYISLAI